MLTRPIVEGQWYLLEDNGMIGQATVHDIGLSSKSRLLSTVLSSRVIGQM